MSIIDEIRKIKQQYENSDVEINILVCPKCYNLPVLYHPEHLDGEMIVTGCNCNNYPFSFGVSSNNVIEIIEGWNKMVKDFDTQLRNGSIKSIDGTFVKF